MPLELNICLKTFGLKVRQLRRKHTPLSESVPGDGSGRQGSSDPRFRPVAFSARLLFIQTLNSVSQTILRTRDCKKQIRIIVL